MSDNQGRGPLWSNKLPDKAKVVGWEIRRAPVKGAMVVQIWSHQVEICPTHNVSKRTQPCLGEICPICERGIQPRYHGYLAGMQMGTYEKVIIEVTAKIAEQLDEHFSELRSLRGAYIRLSRLTPVPNGKILCQVTPKKPTDAECPTGPNVRRIMEAAWRSNIDWINAKTAAEQPAVKIANTGTDGPTWAPQQERETLD
jgi:hypothetical protein